MNNNIPNFANDNTASLVQNQISIAKAQKAEKEREMETEPIRMVGQEMIESGAKGIAGYLTKKTKLKSFGALGANVAKHGVAAGVARTAAAAGHEAFATGGKVAKDQLTKALEKHTAALQQAASGFQTKVKSKVKDLGTSLESRVSNLSDKAQAEAQKRGKQAAAVGNKVLSEGKDAVAKGVGQAQAAVSDVGNKVQAAAGDAQAAVSDVGNKVQAVAGDAQAAAGDAQAAAAAAVPKAGGIAASQAAAASASQKVIDAKLSAEQQRTPNLAAAAPEGGDPRLAAEQQRVPNAFNSKTVTAEPVQSQRFGGLNDQLRKTSAPSTTNDALNSMLSDLQSKSDGAGQGLSDLNMLPKTEQLGKLPSSAAAAKALQNGGATNISRSAARAAPLKAAAGETPSLVKAASGGASGSSGSVGSTFGKKKGGVASQAKAFSVEPNRVSEGSSHTPVQKASSTPVLDEIANARKESGDPRFAASSTIQDTGQSAPGSAPREPELLPGVGGLADNESEEPGLLPGKGGLANAPPKSAAEKLNDDITKAQTAQDAVSQVNDLASTGQSAPGTAPTSASEPSPSNTPAGQIPTTDPTPAPQSSGGGGGGGGGGEDELEEGGEEEGAEEAEGAAGGIESDLQKATAASTVADESPIGDMITGALGIASLVGGLFGGHSGETASPPSMGSMASSYQAGATNNA